MPASPVEQRHARPPHREKRRPHRAFRFIRRLARRLLNGIERRLHRPIDFLPRWRDIRHRGRSLYLVDVFANAMIHGMGVPVYSSHATNGPIHATRCVKTGNCTQIYRAVIHGKNASFITGKSPIGWAKVALVIGIVLTVVILLLLVVLVAT